MRKLRNFNKNIKLFNDFCKNDAYEGPLMKNVDKSLHPFLKCRVKTNFKPGPVLFTKSVYKAKDNFFIMKSVIDVFSFTVSFGGNILFVGPLFSSLKSKNWAFLKKNSKKNLKNHQSFDNSFNMLEDFFNYSKVVNRYSWIYSMRSSFFNNDLIMIRDYEHSKQKLNEGNKLFAPLAPIGSFDIKNVSYPLNLNINDKIMQTWFFFILNEGLHKGFRNRTAPKISRRSKSWISYQISKKTLMLKNYPKNKPRNLSKIKFKSNNLK